MNHTYQQALLCAALAAAGQCVAAEAARARPAGMAALQPCSAVSVDPSDSVTLGKSSVIRLSAPVVRMVVGGYGAGHAGKPQGDADKDKGKGKDGAAATPAMATQDSVADVDIALLSPTELFFLGRKAGAMNIVLQGKDGRCFVRDIVVTVDTTTLQAKLAEVMPDETGIRVKAAENALILTGSLSDGLRLEDVLALAQSYGDGKRVVNLLRVNTQQQVMLK